jgi:hypothetical protein
MDEHTALLEILNGPTASNEEHLTAHERGAYHA